MSTEAPSKELASGTLLAALATADPRDFSPLGAQPFLLVDASVAAPEDELRRTSAWLRQLPCPVIGIGSGALSSAVDVCVEDAAAAAPLVQGIRHSPIAAAVLVQLLRATENLPVADALVAESLAYSALQAGPEFRRWLEGFRAARTAPADSGPAVEVERFGDTLELTLNRPSSRNAMTVEMRDALVEALQLVLADESIRSLRIRGKGKCFSTGGELAEFGTAPDPATAHIVRSLTLPGRLLASCADRAEVQVHGACVGSGIEFPAFARRITATAEAWFQLPELQFGLIPGAGGCVSIARRIGRQRTAWLVLSGRKVIARTALEWGLVDAIVK